MTFESNEFTDETLILKLTEKYGHKKKGGKFTKNDIAQYKTKGQLPRFYGHNLIKVVQKHGIKVIQVEGDF